MGLFLVSLFLGITSWVSINFNDDLLHQWMAQHKARVHTLYLWSGETVGIKTLQNNLIITNWIVVWDANSYSQSTGASIWWWVGNTIKGNSQYAGIAWWQDNQISSWENSIIGWWLDNGIDGKNAVVAWWQHNTSHSWWSIVWWTENTSENNWVVLGWYHNEAHSNGLALWKNANATYNSFAWNATAEANSARINASNWILIWTTQTITWVNLVVNWPTKIAGSNSATWITWEIRSVSWCFYAYDWVNWHIINRNTTWNCNAFNVPKLCKFGNIELQEWDVVTAYKATLATNCESKTVTCKNWELLDTAWNNNYKYAYCFTWEAGGQPWPQPWWGTKCPQQWACPETLPGWICTSYTTNISDDCNSAKVISTCQSDWTWDNTPGDYTWCDKCPEWQHMQKVIDPITQQTTITCVQNKCKWTLPSHAHENNPNATMNDPSASYPSSPSDSTEACERSCDEDYDWVKNPCSWLYECKKADHYEWRFTDQQGNAITKLTWSVTSTDLSPERWTMRAKIYWVYFSQTSVNALAESNRWHRGNNWDLNENNVSTISKFNKYYTASNYGDYGVYATIDLTQFYNSWIPLVTKAPTKDATIEYKRIFLGREDLIVDFWTTSTDIKYTYAADHKDDYRWYISIYPWLIYLRIWVDRNCLYDQNNPYHDDQRHGDIRSSTSVFTHGLAIHAVPTPIYKYNECTQ